MNCAFFDLVLNLNEPKYTLNCHIYVHIHINTNKWPSSNTSSSYFCGPRKNGGES